MLCSHAQVPCGSGNDMTSDDDVAVRYCWPTAVLLADQHSGSIYIRVLGNRQNHLRFSEQVFPRRLQGVWLAEEVYSRSQG